MAKLNSRHWFESLVEQVKSDRGEIMEQLKSTFADTYSTRGPKPLMSKRQELAMFMGMDSDSRLRLADELGPEQWNAKVDEMMTGLVEQIGPSAHKMMPWILGQQPEEAEPLDRDTLEQELYAMLGGETVE